MNIINSIIANYEECLAMVLFAIGFFMLVLNRNLIKKIIGLNIMDTAMYLFLAALGYIEGRQPPIIVDGNTDPSLYINPIPTGLVLTGIVVSVSFTAIMLALSIRLYKRYHTLNLDDIYMYAQEEQE